MGRKILAVVAALITASAIFLLIQMIATLFAFETPKNIEYMTREEIAAYMKTVPVGGYLTVLFGYLLGSFAGGWMVTKVSKARNSTALPFLVGALLTIGAIGNFFFVLPGQPLWFVVLSLISYIPLALFGHRFAR